MKTSNLIKRIITCVLGIPALIALIFLLPQHNFIGFSVLVIAFAFLGSLEMSEMIFGKKTFLSYISFFTVFVSYFHSSLTDLCLIILIIGVFAFEIKHGEKDSFKNSVLSMAKNILILLYPSYFMTFAIRFIQSKDVNSYVILLFLLLVFSNDIFAYVFGMLFGRNNAGIFKVSPKKSIAGFAGGTLGCIAVCLVYFALFGSHMIFFTPIERILLAFASSVAANIGDLAESVIKRCCNVKDSGAVIPGRGGILDCSDSIMTASVFFYIIFSL